MLNPWKEVGPFTDSKNSKACFWVLPLLDPRDRVCEADEGAEYVSVKTP